MEKRLRQIQKKWTGITLAVMFVLPFAVARMASECAGMALCMLLFLVVNPVYSILLGMVAGRNVRSLWRLPVVSAAAFLAGAWLFFSIHELWFMAYAGAYLCIGLASMCTTNYVKHSRADGNG